ncbi:MAG: polysaccharide biosynthesis C-terminal domain-containing protein [[Clostridium] scindens]
MGILLYIYIDRFFSKEAIEIIASKSYLPAWEVVPLIVLTYAIKIPYYFYVTVLFYYKKATNKVFIITLSTSLLNIFLSALFIPELSMIGSVLADAISMGSRVALVIVFSKKFGDVGFRLWSIVSRIIYTMVIMGVFLLPSYLNGSIGTLFEILVKIVGVLVFMAGILVFERKNLGNVKVIMLSGIDKIFRKGERE